MQREEIVKKAEEQVNEEELKQEIDKVIKLIRKIRESEKLVTENKKALEDYLAGKPLIRITENPNGDICISNGYTVETSHLTLSI